MHERDKTNVQFGYPVKYSCNDFTQHFWIFASLCRTIGNFMISMRRNNGIYNDAWLNNSRCCTLGNSVIIRRTKICIPYDDLASLSLCQTVGSTIITKKI